MKTNVKMLSVALIVFLAVSLYLPNLSYSRHVIKWPEMTECRNQVTEVLSGYSNDCVQGDGDCIDNTCLQGSAEIRPE